MLQQYLGYLRYLILYFQVQLLSFEACWCTYLYLRFVNGVYSNNLVLVVFLTFCGSYFDTNIQKIATEYDKEINVWMNERLNRTIISNKLKWK